jgi:hypothetical protein
MELDMNKPMDALIIDSIKIVMGASSAMAALQFDKPVSKKKCNDLFIGPVP